MNDTCDILSLIDPDRLVDNLWRLVNIPSPTGNERDIAVAYGDMLTQLGLDVRLDDRLPQSPNVIARMCGKRPGPCLQLAGHLDHIDIPHPPPCRDDNKISGRGSADMKNGLAGILEIVNVLNALEGDFPGEILITAYGLHEAPVGDFRGLLNLLQDGVKGDAAIVFEGPHDRAAVMANGMAIWDLTVKHRDRACHEQCTDADKLELFNAAVQIVNCLQALNDVPAENAYPLLKPPSCFLGQCHYGDFYNRLPDTCTLQGTRRWQPDATFDDVKQRFEQVVRQAVTSEKISVQHDWRFVGDSYAIAPDEPIVQCLRGAYSHIHAAEMPVTGHSSVTDTCRLVRQGGVPAVLCGFGSDTGHADREFVTIQQLIQSTRVALLTVMNYLHFLTG